MPGHATDQESPDDFPHADPLGPVSGGPHDAEGRHAPPTRRSAPFLRLVPPYQPPDPDEPVSGPPYDPDGLHSAPDHPVSAAPAHSHAADPTFPDQRDLRPAFPDQRDPLPALPALPAFPDQRDSRPALPDHRDAGTNDRPADPLDPSTPIELNDDLDLFASAVEPAGDTSPGPVVEPASSVGDDGTLRDDEPLRGGSGSYALVGESILDAGTFVGDPAPPVQAETAAAHDGPRPIPPALSRAGVDGLQATGYLPIVRPGAAGFPPELAAIAPPDAEPKPEPKDAKGPDPEQILAGYEWRFDPDTLREQIEGDEVGELQEIRDLLTAKLNTVEDNPSRARLLSLRAVVSRILNDLPKAFADGKLALAHAEATGELRRIAIAQARLAHVLQWREEFEEADRLFTQANSSELPDRLRATMHQHTGKCAYDQGRYMEACNHFELALDLRKEEDPELIAQTELALDAVFRRVAEKGWGPYPRSREEILNIRKPPAPALDETTQRWGFVTSNGEFCIGPGYVDVQPFRDGVAWVQRHGAETWELIDDGGRSLIDPTAGYLGVSSFSDGLAWVSRDGTTRWIAIDKNNTVLISTGFEDVRPFRRGVAAVRRNNRWGAVDGVGRMVVPFQFDGFATALHDGRYIDGFNDEGLAVVSLSGRKGVVDRSGRVIVPPVHHVLMVHPVAFLVADESQRWGALDRRGRPVIDLTFPSRMGVIDEIDRLLADTRPVM
jgi:tetratricopeptide (TPR) repeat protein